MKLEVGKTYNVRSGQGSVTITAVEWGVYKGTYTNGDRTQEGTWRDNGMVYYNGKISGKDIVSEVQATNYGYGWPYQP